MVKDVLTAPLWAHNICMDGSKSIYLCHNSVFHANFIFMKIRNISISGFCNIKQFDIDLTEFNALVAPNNYGKSNVLEGIRFAFLFINATEEKRKLMMSDPSFIPINIATSGDPFRFKIELTKGEGNDEMKYTYSFSFEWARNNGDEGCYIVGESLSEISKDYRRPHTLIKREMGDGGLYVSSVTARCNKEANASRVQLVIDILNANDNLFFKDIVYGLKGLGMNMVGTSGFEKQTLCKYIYELKGNDPMKYSLFEDAVTHIVPNIKAITPTCSQLGLSTGNVPYRIEDVIYDMRINEKSNNQDISISRLSSGSRRIITIIAEIIKAEITGSSLICIEELENSVHPKLLENIILIVQSFAEGIDVLITSHSPYLVRYLKSNQLTFGLPTEEGVASFHKLKPTKVKTIVKRASAMEMTLGEYMFELMLNLKPESEEIVELFD